LRNANGTDVVLTAHLNFMKTMKFVCMGKLAKCTPTHLPFPGCVSQFVDRWIW